MPTKNDESLPVVIDRSLRLEAEAQRNAEARIGAADIAQCRARMAALKSSGRIVDPESGEMVTVPASVVRVMLEAKEEN